jgi:hypothetical protein
MAKRKPAAPKPAGRAKPAQHKRSSAGASLQELKAEVFALAGVSSTPALKRGNVDLAHLDFRRKVCWQKAVEILRAGAKAITDARINPPEDLRELFHAIDEASTAYGAAIEAGFELSRQVRRSADDLEALSAELLDDADELRGQQQASRKQARQRQLN